MKEFSEKLKIAYDNFYSREMWKGMGGGSKSGLGSSIEYTKSYSKNLIEILKYCNINTIFDCSCGDWFWMKHIKDDFSYYVGNDICEKLIFENKQKFETDNIRFVSNDMLSQMKKYNNYEFDLSICRHTFEHLPTDYVIESILEMKRISKYALITTSNHHKRNEDIEIDFNYYNGSFRVVNLDEYPYVDILPSPILKFWDSVAENESSVGSFGYLYKFENETN